MWTLRQEHYYSKIRIVHHRVLLRIIRTQRKIRDHRITLYSLRARRRCLWAGTPVEISGGQLLNRIVPGNFEGAVLRGWSGKETEWTNCVQNDVQAFGKVHEWIRFRNADRLVDYCDQYDAMIGSVVYYMIRIWEVNASPLGDPLLISSMRTTGISYLRP